MLWHDELSHVGLCASRIYHSPACLAMNSLQTVVGRQFRVPNWLLAI